MVEVSRISTLGLHTTTMNNFTKLQGDLSVLQDQISSGVKGRDFEAFNGQVEQFVGLEKEVKRITQYMENNTITVSRLQTQENVLRELVDLGDKIENLMIGENPGTANNATFTTQMNQLRYAISQELNVNDAGRYLFGGTRSDVPPVIDNPSVPDPFVSGVPDDGYYQGSKDNMTSRAQDNVEFEFDVRADNPAFQKLFASMSLAKEASAAQDTQKWAKAKDLIKDAIGEIIALEADVSNRRVEVERINARHKEQKTYFASVISEIASVDTVAAASKVSIDQATLTATFQVFARISSLRLSDFL
jgi:flagellar hook-associated protein 3 FlgL